MRLFISYLRALKFSGAGLLIRGEGTVPRFSLGDTTDATRSGLLFSDPKSRTTPERGQARLVDNAAVAPEWMQVIPLLTPMKIIAPLALLLVLSSVTAPAVQVDPARLALLTHGVNLSHWFSQSHLVNGTYPHDWLRTYDGPADFKLLAQAGFRHVRFPVEMEMFLDEQKPGELNAAYLADFDSAMDQILGAGLAVIVDWHAREDTKDRLRTDDHLADAAVSLWGAMARHLAGRDPARVFLEIMNEPAGGMSQERWIALQDRMLATIRAQAPRHTIIYAGHKWSGLDELLLLKPVADPNVVYDFHFYEPMVFTHQTAPWPGMGLEPIKGLRYPMESANRQAALEQVGSGKGRKYLLEYTADRAWLAHRLQAAADWAARYGVAITCNEFGVYRPVAPAADRTAWLRDTRLELEARQIGWTMWDYAGGFAVTHGEKPGQRALDPDVLQALGVEPHH